MSAARAESNELEDKLAQFSEKVKKLHYSICMSVIGYVYRESVIPMS